MQHVGILRRVMSIAGGIGLRIAGGHIICLGGYGFVCIQITGKLLKRN